MIQLLLTGFVSILGQVVLLREINVALYGVELFYVLAMGSWLLLTATGAAIGGHNPRRYTRHAPLLFVLFGLSLPSGLLLARGIRVLFGGVPGAYLPLWLQTLAAVLPLMPAGLVSGLLFRATANAYLERGESPGRAYGLESIGGLAGGLAATLSLDVGLSNLQIALACAAAGFSALAARPEPDRGPTRLRRAAAAALVLACAVTLPFSYFVDRRTTEWNHNSDVLEVADGPYGRITVTELGGQVSVFENDALAFTTERVSAEEFVHLALIQRPEPRRILILGGVVEGTVQEALQHGPTRVDVVEVDPLLPDLVFRHLSAGARQSLSDPRVRLIHEDPRRFIARAEPYDAVLVGMPEPSSGQTNRFYTVEFFRICRERLSAGGILAFRLQSSENYWTPELQRRAGSVYRALAIPFSSIVVLPGSANVFLASDAPLEHDVDRLCARLLERGVRTRLVSPPYLRFLYRNDRFGEIRRVLRESAAPPNSDERPIVYRQTLSLWVSRFTGFAGWDFGGQIRGRQTWVLSACFLASLVALAFAGRSRPRLGRLLLVCAAGFAGMILETLIMLHYQVQRGVLYRDLGILLMSFMAGLALGAFAMGRLGAPSSRRRSGLRGAVLMLGIAAAGGALALSYGGGRSSGLAETMLLLLFAGSLVSAVFAHAAEAGSRGDVGPLYAADLVGGSIGAILGSLFLVPLAGFAWTAVLVIPIALACLILV